MSTATPTILSWSLDGLNKDGRYAWARDDDSFRQVILAILLTRPGERLLRPTFGAGLLDFVHEPNNETTRSMIAARVRKALAHWEPRIRVQAVEVVADPQDPAAAHITIRYLPKHTGVPTALGLTLSLALSDAAAGAPAFGAGGA
ncbi:MAG: GPW/gp25 family protein [Thiohalocapsa sp.]|jgi:hypothetical protein|uniref:GPW/gp25 family protein n=1 Tax=Thiohalocapsa sp. TaxID=2497641 RepID=UPI0025ED1EC5|nr:GPW/gp25 family protein [Thiohalocapsa sp.]MCG6942869.1 GPW/gp25 family protein [Thiohalocapsa sp.]